MKKIFYLGLGIVGVSLSTLLFTACVKKDFKPPIDNSQYDPELHVTHTIQEIQTLPQGQMIEEDIIIQGVVVMDDKSGNYYKKIVFQDETGGIEILLDQNNLYNDYPIGRKIYVKLNGLYLGNYGSNLQIGYTPDASGALSQIPFILIDNYIVKANYPNEITPKVVTLSELASPNAASQYLNTLVKIEDVEFSPEHAGVSYAQLASLASATNRNIKDCSNGTIILRTSGYAKFQSDLTPTGNGSLVAVYTRHNNTPQLFIRDTDDVQFNNERCDGTNPDPVDVTHITMDSLRSLYNGSDVTLPPVKVSGIVISDIDNGNVSHRNVVVQGSNNDKGIVLFYNQGTDYKLGDSIEVVITGNVLKEFQNKLEVEGVDISQTIVHAQNRSITPKVVTIGEVVADRKKYESTLVKILNASFEAGAPTYNGTNGNLSITDGTGTIKHYSALNTTFKDDPLPTSPVQSITGFIDIHNQNVQIRFRNPHPPVNDVTP